MLDLVQASGIHLSMTKDLQTQKKKNRGKSLSFSLKKLWFRMSKSSWHSTVSPLCPDEACHFISSSVVWQSPFFIILITEKANCVAFFFLQCQCDNRTGHKPGARVSLLSTSPSSLALVGQEVQAEIPSHTDWEYYSKYPVNKIHQFIGVYSLNQTLIIKSLN